MTKTYVRTIKPYNQLVEEARKFIKKELTRTDLITLSDEIDISYMVLTNFVKGSMPHNRTFEKILDYILRVKECRI